MSAHTPWYIVQLDEFIGNRYLNRHAKSRNDFLKAFRYGYKDDYQRKRHERLAEKARADTLEYQDRHKTHLENCEEVREIK